jgi:hypothetical protein
MTNPDQTLESAILDLLAQRGPGKTICPSDAARQVDPHGWRSLMDKTRQAAQRLVDQGAIVVTQQGKIVDPSKTKGPIRLKIR